MNEKDLLCRRASILFLGGYNCAQSVVLTMCEHWGVKNDLIPKVATGFGGGIGRCGSVCGALTGAIIAVGIKHGTNAPSPEKREEAYNHARALYRQFEKQFGSVSCRGLIGYDLSDPEQLEKARKVKVFEEKCAGFVMKVIELAAEL